MSAIVAVPDGTYGPFTGTEVNIYCDESRHEGQNQQRFMVIGGLWLPRAHRGEVLGGIRRLQAEHLITSELKWGKVSRSKLTGYQSIIDWIASRDDVHFRCIVVDKSKVELDKYFQNDRQLSFWSFYLHCLKQWLGNGNTYNISIDFKPESLHSGPRRLLRVLEKECVGRAWLNALNCVDSRENLFCQVADVLIGAVGYEQNGLSTSAAKQALCGHIARRFHRADLNGSDDPARQQFNIFRI
ncbi:MAG TPA: DUF3800 domain-containing protein [Verrucomicrobiae bacterium]|nr:DUF3800 domain-containing protein [Verrucomicrobiae bacterium]